MKKFLFIVLIFVFVHTVCAVEIIAMGGAYTVVKKEKLETATVSLPERIPYLDCFKTAAKRYNLPVSLLVAIAKIESGLRPYVFNVRGKSYNFDNTDSAFRFLSKQKSKVDIGIMQVNSHWFKKLGYPLVYGLSPCFNIYLGAYVLRKKINRYGYNWFGIAAYHSATPLRNKNYALKAAKIIQALEAKRWFAAEN